MAKEQPPEARLVLLEYHRGHLATSFDVTADQAGSGTTSGTGGTGARRDTRRSAFSGAASLLRAAFLPEGFPDSVSPDYLGFQAWDTIQALSSYVRGVLTSQAILRGVGVGQQASTPLAAVFTFFVRDLAGMLGGILFAYLEGSSFDSCAKQWRLFADITNDLGMTVELASPLFPRAMFLPIACLGSIARSLTGVAGGATRAALTQHFARRGNAADVSAKEQSQETATTIIGMVAGMAVTRLLAATEAAAGSGSGTAAAAWAWVVFLALTALHVVANVAAMRVLVLSSLNTPRLELLVDRYLRDGHVLTPREVSKLEDLTPPPFRRLLDLVTGASWRRRVQLQYGSRLTSALRATAEPTSGGGANKQQPQPQRATAARLAQLLRRQGDRPYLLLTTSTSTTSPARRAQIHLVLRRGATTADQLRAFVHARCLAHLCSSTTSEAGGEMEGPGAAERAAEAWMVGQYGSLVSELSAAGWHTDRVTLPRPAWTAEWGPAPPDGAELRPHAE